MFAARNEVTIDDVTYKPGGKFRVIAEGATLNGWAPHPTGGHVGWRQELHVGDVITCTGFGPGWGGDPGYGVEFTSEQSTAARASHCDVFPSSGSVFRFHPAAGYLEPIDD